MDSSEISTQTQYKKQSCITVLLQKASIWVLIVIISELLKATEQIETSSSRSSNALAEEHDTFHFYLQWTDNLSKSNTDKTKCK